MHAVDRVVRAALAGFAPAARIALALSGGRDSMALLHALTLARRARPAGRGAVHLSAIHVHHGLSTQAGRWADFCAAQCAAREVPLTVVRVAVTRRGGESLEAVARTARYQALAACGADIVVLAHHADDQAETLLLQLLRGAGPHGLAAMAAVRHHRSAVFARPLLDVSGAGIADYAASHALQWIEDDSNHDLDLRRNALRRLIVPALRAGFPGYPDTVVRATRHQAEAARLLDDLAALDAGPITRRVPGEPQGLDLAALRALHATRPDRARNLLRWFVRQHGVPAPSTDRLEAWLRQCTSTATPRMRQLHAGHELSAERGRLVLRPSRAPATPFETEWRGAGLVRLPAGTLRAERCTGRGLALALLSAGPLIVRSRRGGERVRVAPDRPRQSLAEFLRLQRTPLQDRRTWPVLWRDGVVIAVPGMGVDPDWAAGAGEPGVVVHWQPGA